MYLNNERMTLRALAPSSEACWRGVCSFKVLFLSGGDGTNNKLLLNSKALRKKVGRVAFHMLDPKVHSFVTKDTF